MNEALEKQMTQEYVDLVKEWAGRNNYPMSDQSMRTAAKVLMHRDKALDYPPGHFIQALLDNDLRGVMSRADDDSWKNFTYIYRAWYNIDAYHLKWKYDALIKQEAEEANV